MPPEPVTDSSGSREHDRGVRFVDTDLSIQPSHHGAVEKEAENERGADKYYKDMQSIHGDTVLAAHSCSPGLPAFKPLYWAMLVQIAWRTLAAGCL